MKLTRVIFGFLLTCEKTLLDKNDDVLAKIGVDKGKCNNFCEHFKVSLYVNLPIAWLKFEESNIKTINMHL